MVNLKKKIINIIDNIYVLNFIMILAIVSCFYPISSSTSILGYFSSIYLAFHWRNITKNKLFITIMLFSGWIFVSVVLTYNDFSNYTSSFIDKDIKYFLLFLAASLIIPVIGFKNFIIQFLSVGTIFTFLGYLEVIFGNNLDWFFHIFRNRTENIHLYLFDDVPRLLSISRSLDPNFVGFIIAVLLVTTFAIFLYKLETLKKIDKRYFAGNIFFGIALLLTASRGAILIALFSIITLLFSFAVKRNSKNAKILLSIVIALPIMGTILMSIIFPDNILTHKILLLANHETWRAGTSEGMRFEMWNLSINILKDNPFFGVGPTGFEVCTKLPEYYVESLFKHNFRDPHNFILSVGMFGGIPGIILIVSILIQSLYKNFKGITETLNLKKVILLGWTLCFIGTSIFEYSLTEQCKLIFLYLFFSCIIMKDDENENKHR